MSHTKLIAFLCSIMFGCTLYSQQNQSDIIQYVENNRTFFLEEIPSSFLPNYGFSSSEEIANAVVATPIEVFTLFDDTLRSTNTWRVPLMVNNEYRALFTVVQGTDNAIEIVDFGAAQLAKILSTENQSGNINAILRVYSLHTDFVFDTCSKEEIKFKKISPSNREFYSLSQIVEQSKSIRYE